MPPKGWKKPTEPAKDPRRRRYAVLRMQGLNCAEACEQAGYKQNSRANYSKQGSRLDREPDVIAYRKKIEERIESDAVASVQEVLEYVTNTLRGKNESEVVLVVASGGGLTEAQRVKKQPDERERLEAGRILLKYYQDNEQRKEPDKVVRVVLDYGDNEGGG